MKDLVSYLQEKIRTSKRNIACNYFKTRDNVEEELAMFLQYSYDILLSGFHMEIIESNQKKGSQTGEANLTKTITSIGAYVYSETGSEKAIDEAPWEWFKRTTLMGNLFIEAFYQHHWINIGKNYNKEFIPFEELNYNQKKSQAPYIIVPEQWPDDPTSTTLDLLHGITTEMPLPINDIIQPTKRSVIKGWEIKDRMRFRQYLYRDWVESLNILQQTGWSINKEVYQVLMDSREDILASDVNIVSAEDGHRNVDTKAEAKLAKRADTKRFVLNRTLEKAGAVLDKTFYYYMECDYRGRIYNTASFLNFASNDIARGQMLFSEKKLMTDEGLYWLAIHTACSYNQSYSIDEIPEWTSADYISFLQEEELTSISVDKMTLDDRVQWTMNNMSWILELWEKKELRYEAEKFVSFLACCREWAKVWEAHDNNEDYYSQLPIPVDGSNNGWQHLSAMSKDAHAASLVGVVPQDIQKDFYVQTAKELIKLMPEWFSERQMPMKAIRKGIAKRGSMTRAYSAGAAKIAENMYLDCYVEGYTDKYNITEDDCIELSKNLVKAIDIVCSGPLKTMKFLQKIAEQEIASDWAIEASRKMMQWTTPSGFPVEYAAWSEMDLKQDVNISCDKRAKQPINQKTGEIYDNIRMCLAGKEYTDKPKIRSFMSGISPNFVHSMDASHMSAVIKEWGGSFGPVHDSFSVHASDVPDLLGIIKNEFVKMYDYHNFFDEIERMVLSEPTEFTYNQPELGSLEIREVKDSDYFFA